MTFGERIKALREQRRMTLEDVAKALNVGRATIFKYENGKISNIPPDKTEALAKLFSVSPAYLMGWEKEEPDQIDQVIPITPEARILSKGIDQMPKEQREAVINLMSGLYPGLFKKGS